jgi:hypothetical protein
VWDVIYRVVDSSHHFLGTAYEIMEKRHSDKPQRIVTAVVAFCTGREMAIGSARFIRTNQIT